LGGKSEIMYLFFITVGLWFCRECYIRYRTTTIYQMSFEIGYTEGFKAGNDAGTTVVIIDKTKGESIEAFLNRTLGDTWKS